MASEIMVDEPHVCDDCGELFYVSGGLFYYEIETGGEVHYCTDENPLCPLCGGTLSPTTVDHP